MKIWFILLSLLSTIPTLAATISEEKAMYNRMIDTRHVLLPHRGNYILPFVYNNIPHESLYSHLISPESKGKGDYYKKEEAEFQFSLLFPIHRNVFSDNVDLHFGYTHHAWWQAYNGEWSRPFRETNYMPELFTRYLNPSNDKIWGFNLLALDTGFVHHSNGQIEQLSRSWNRIFARSYLQSDYFVAIVSSWWRVPEESDNDDNPDIENYYGYGDVEILKSFGKHVGHAKVAIASHGSLDLKYSYPWREHLRWFLSAQTGYAHSLIEYDRPTQRIGVGITLDTLLDSYYANKD
jgi:phospholipase A1